MRLWLLISIALLLSVSAAVAQSSVHTKKKELEDLRRSINATQHKLDKLQRDERSARSNISSYTKQRYQISRFINELQVELQRLQDSAAVLRTQIKATSQALKSAEDAYSQTARELMTYKSEHRGDLAAKPLIDPIFRTLTSSLAAYRATMLTLKDSLQEQQSLLDQYSTTQTTVLQTQTKQERSLATNISKSSKQLEAIRSDTKAVKAELKMKRQSVNRLRAIIAEQVAAARRKAEAERKRKQRSNAPSTSPPASTPESIGGFPPNSLPWPTRSHKILHGYGSYRNPQTGTTLDNPGIDISTPVGSSVHAVAKGQVSSVTWLPGFGSLVIIDHGNDVRTVYANLATVAVAKGAQVSLGTALGTSGENIDGALVHFELWHGKNRKDPRGSLK